MFFVVVLIPRWSPRCDPIEAVARFLTKTEGWRSDGKDLKIFDCFCEARQKAEAIRLRHSDHNRRSSDNGDWFTRAHVGVLALSEL